MFSACLTSSPLIFSFSRHNSTTTARRRHCSTILGDPASLKQYVDPATHVRGRLARINFSNVPFMRVTQAGCWSASAKSKMALGHCSAVAPDKASPIRCSKARKRPSRPGGGLALSQNSSSRLRLPCTDLCELKMDVLRYGAHVECGVNWNQNHRGSP